MVHLGVQIQAAPLNLAVAHGVGSLQHKKKPNKPQKLQHNRKTTQQKNPKKNKKQTKKQNPTKTNQLKLRETSPHSKISL